MNEKKIERIGKLLTKAELIDDWEIKDFGIDYEWVEVIFQLNTEEVKTLNVTFNKKYGYIMDMSFSEGINLLEKDF